MDLSGHDADTAALLIKENGHADIIIYHIHQAVEKMIKALLVKNGKAFDKTHFLDKLLAQAIKIDPKLSNIEDDVLAINLYLPKLRYPYGDVIKFEEAIVIYNKFLAVQKLLRGILHD
ncbi:hypothetical protein A2292_01790 [candidate division WOR-1 bacterium RIFOXYB2_FULL_46_45]|nr:MAG: hypothetical protein A2292_01790 [candidate division WOR-1 bacterium RIFOXYB2_FULL_46_45]